MRARPRTAERLDRVGGGPGQGPGLGRGPWQGARVGAGAWERAAAPSLQAQEPSTGEQDTSLLQEQGEVQLVPNRPGGQVMEQSSPWKQETWREMTPSGVF